MNNVANPSAYCDVIINIKEKICSVKNFVSNSVDYSSIAGNGLYASITSISSSVSSIS